MKEIELPHRPKKFKKANMKFNSDYLSKLK